MKIKRMCIYGALLAGSVAVSVFGAVPGPGYEQLVQELENSDNPAVRPSQRVPVNQAWLDAHAARQLLLDADNGPFDYFIVGDSITAKWSTEELDNLFGAGKAMNLGQSADKTEHIIWRLLDHDMNQPNPKVAMVLAGTNNSNNDEYSVEEIAGGVEAIVQLLRTKLPETRILLLGIFPRGSRDQRIGIKSGLTEADMNPQWEKIDRVNRIIETFADGEHIIYLNINPAFLNENGALPIAVMPDLLHPNKKGYELWGNAIMPTLEKLTTTE
jgi:lysophospholipase L1-like esterase